MAVDDLWYRTQKDGGERVPTQRHGTGKRYRVRYTDPNGNAKTRAFEKKGDAERFDVKVRADVARGDYVDPGAGRSTFREVAEKWRANQPHRHNTVQQIESLFNRHVYPHMGERPIGS